MRLSPDKVQLATVGGLLHDIGKMLIPPEILNKKEELTEYEMRALREHVVKGYELVMGKGLDSHIVNCILMHHERRDGKDVPPS